MPGSGLFRATRERVDAVPVNVGFQPIRERRGTRYGRHCRHRHLRAEHAQLPALRPAAAYTPAAKCSRQKDRNAIVAAAGIVSTQAQIMSVARPQRTAFIRWMLPTPTMAPAMACVVETG